MIATHTSLPTLLCNNLLWTSTLRSSSSKPPVQRMMTMFLPSAEALELYRDKRSAVDSKFYGNFVDETKIADVPQAWLKIINSARCRCLQIFSLNHFSMSFLKFPERQQQFVYYLKSTRSRTTALQMIRSEIVTFLNPFVAHHLDSITIYRLR